MTDPHVHPYWFDWITVLAIVAGPVLALWTQRILDGVREQDKTQKQLYFTLMSTRAIWLSNEHVTALNSIDIVFAKDKNIRNLWKECLDHLATDESTEGWTEIITNLRVDLYQAIGNKLGYRYTSDYIKRGIYFPKRHTITITNQDKVLAGLAKAVEDGKLKVSME
jgi:uncharacterized protein DUF6680